MKIIFLISLFFITSSVYAHPNFCPEANLSDEQKAQIKELRQNFRNATQGLSKDERRAAKTEMQQTILENIATTDEQRQALSQCFERRKKRRGCPEANFSDEQKAQIKELRQNFRNAHQGQVLTKEQRRAAKTELRQNILDTVPMSDEQRTALLQCFERRKKHKH